jgi:Uma2 family endonuclease
LAKEEDTVAMATLPIDEAFVTVREYLRTSYSPDCEYVDGRIVARNVGEKGHSILQMYLGFLFMLNRATWGVEIFPELRTHVATRRFRIPDVLVTRSGVKFKDVLDSPPLIAIEILSPDDRLSDLQEKIDEYLAFGMEHIWVFDPRRRVAWIADMNGLHQVTADALCVPGTPIWVVLGEAWAELDRV